MYREPRHVRLLEPVIPRIQEGHHPAAKFLQRLIDGYHSQQHKQTADFIIRSRDGTEFHAHRYLLMAQSPVFAAMLTHNSREKQRSRCELKDVDGETVQLLLDYVYGCDTGKITKNNAEKVLIMADKYEMMDLRGHCEQTLADGISVEKAFPYLVLSVQRGLDVLKAAALRMMPKYLDAVLKGKGLEEVMQSDPELIQIFMDYCAKKLPQT
ncbi:speckle-type POZ protein B-like [Paramacrobiotus metropolitanus]|uniref:speckle-type POZ protein B-like n=1 Tax=Paramacrobiotus metropolitanus TaxID=2943436 RepID=UPI002445C653|nr:speckle-type POZ protein B-like [Paramacrobiotus metropolitanus]XP_055348905.1 speckle-type POZ protein B-like [Paramacrobiotus metropolitanus]